MLPDISRQIFHLADDSADKNGIVPGCPWQKPASGQVGEDSQLK